MAIPRTCIRNYQGMLTDLARRICVRNSQGMLTDLARRTCIRNSQGMLTDLARRLGDVQMTSQSVDTGQSRRQGGYGR